MNKRNCLKVMFFQKKSDGLKKNILIDCVADTEPDVNVCIPATCDLQDPTNKL